jgi:hypothetical protein
MKPIILNLKMPVLLLILTCSSGCNNYLDIVPDDGLATLENAFTMRTEAEKYLYTCYSYMPWGCNLGPFHIGRR